VNVAKVPTPKTPAKPCECKIVPPGQSTTDPTRFQRCHEHATRFVNTPQGRVYLCGLHMTQSFQIGGTQVPEFYSRVRPRRRIR
jgi:hypothetical protein